MSRPVFTLVSGANGAGKSTLTSYGRVLLGNIPVLDPDLIASTLQSTSSATFAIAAGREVLAKAAEHIAMRRSFAVETTLSGKLYLNMMSQTRQIGYQNVIIYIGTANVEINFARIAQRVRAGGHDVPEEDVRRRYKRSLLNLPAALRLADNAIIFDNSGENAYRAIGVLDYGAFEWTPEMPSWAATLK